MVSPLMELRAFVDGRQVAQSTIGPGVHTLGRAPSCAIVLEAEMVSRQHARLVLREDGAVLLEDLGSSHGTFLDDQPVESLILVARHQSIRIGTVQVLIEPRMESPSLPDVFRGAPRYEIGAEIAKGGMGAILAARQPAIQREVAMKVMLRAESAVERQRFINEARVTGQLEHPNIVPVHELDVDEHGQPYYTMKRVRGVTLKHVLAAVEEGLPAARAKYPLTTLLTVFQKVCDGIAFAHSRGILHRDLKPDNIMLGDYGEVLVMDWGLAKFFRENGSAVSPPGGPSVGSGGSLPGAFATDGDFMDQTMVGTVMGTPAYMSPEQARGEVDDLDSRSDVYALGAILFQILRLRPPYSGRDANEIIEKVQRGAVEWKTTAPTPAAAAGNRTALLPHLPAGRVPDSLAAVVRKAMSFRKNDRYAGVAELQHDLEAYQNGFATTAEKASVGRQLALALKRHKAVTGAVAAGLILLVAVSVAFTTRVVQERNRAVAERQRATAESDRALAALALVEEERNRTQDALTETQTERTRAESALAVAEDQRNRARKALADAEAERLRANSEQSRAEKERLAAQEEREKAAAEATRAQTAMTNAKTEAARAERAMANLKNTAPDIFMSARTSLDNGQIEEAVTKVVQAIQTDPQGIEYRVFHAELLQAMGKVEPAIAEYRKILELQAAHPTATTNLELCERMLKANQGPSPLRKELQQELLAALFQQKQGADANALAAGLAGPLVAVTRAKIRKELGVWAAQAKWGEVRLRPLLDGTFALNLDELEVPSLIPLVGQPISELSMVSSKLRSTSSSERSLLSPLASSLRKLTVSASIAHLAAPEGLRLTSYTVKEEGVYRSYRLANLRMLANQPLQELNLDGIAIVELNDRGYRAWDPIEKAPLTHLSLNKTYYLKDLIPLAHFPLEYLDISNTGVIDLKPLRDCRTLRTLLLTRCPVVQIEAIQKLQLNTISLSDCAKLRDITPLRGQPLKSVTLDGTEVLDLEPLLENTVLEELVLPPIPKARIPKRTLQGLRQLPNLRRISFKRDAAGRPDLTAEQFWAELEK